MKIIYQKFIYRSDLRKEPNHLFIFGDNLERTGFGGQAKEMRGEPNAFGIATKRKAAHGSDDCYMWDHEQSAWDAVNADFDDLESKLTECTHTVYSANDPYELKWKAVVIPTDGIGTGLARLKETAPKLLEHIKIRLDNLANL